MRGIRQQGFGFRNRREIGAARAQPDNNIKGLDLGCMMQFSGSEKGRTSAWLGPRASSSIRILDGRVQVAGSSCFVQS